MVKKIFPLWIDDKEISLIKIKARKDRQSTSQFLIKKALGKNK